MSNIQNQINKIQELLNKIMISLEKLKKDNETKKGCSVWKVEKEEYLTKSGRDWCITSCDESVIVDIRILYCPFCGSKLDENGCTKRKGSE